MIAPEHSQLLVIGKDISWDELAKHNKSGLLRATDFQRLASFKGDNLKAVSPTMPYGILIVECLELRSSFTLFITHRLDALHLLCAYDWCQNPKEQESALQERAEIFQSLTGRDDFMNVYCRVWSTRGMEVLVSRFLTLQRGVRKLARKVSGALLPSLVVLVYPKGYLERAVLNDWKGLDSVEWSAMIEPLLRYGPQI